MKRCVIIILLLSILSMGLIYNASSKTQTEIQEWLDDQVKNARVHGSGNYVGQCVPFVSDYLSEFWGISGVSAAVAKNFPCPSGWSDIDIDGDASKYQMGDIVVEDWGDGIGHVAVYYGVSNGKHYVVDQNYSNRKYVSKHIWSDPITSVTHCYRASGPQLPRKNVLSGVYVIHSAWNDNICLDISGDSTENNANIQLYQRTYNDVQKFRIIKWDSDYYCIKSIHSGLWLDAARPIRDNSNVKLYTTNEDDEDFWYFEDAGDGYVYIKNKTGFYLYVQGDQAVNNANVQLYSFAGNNSQKWRLEEVTNYYSLTDGQYTIQSAIDNNYRFDITGNSTEVDANIQLYEKEKSTVQLFRFQKQGNYFTIQSVYSGKWLDIKTPITNKSNVKLWGDNLSAENHWYLEDAGNGYVYIRSGADYYLDVEYDQAVNNANIQVYRFVGTNFQKWLLVHGEHTVTFDANGGINVPESQTKTYGSDLSLRTEIPERTGYLFVNWNTKIDGTGVSYEPGGVLEDDEDITLYAVWQRKLENVMVLPGSLTEIEEEAFVGTSADAFVIPPSVTAIGRNAFDDVVIYGYAGSYAETYANANGLDFIPLTDE